MTKPLYALKTVSPRMYHPVRLLLGRVTVQFVTPATRSSSPVSWHAVTSSWVMSVQSEYASSDAAAGQVQFADGHEYCGMDQGFLGSLFRMAL